MNLLRVKAFFFPMYSDIDVEQNGSDLYYLEPQVVLNCISSAVYVPPNFILCGMLLNFFPF